MRKRTTGELLIRLDTDAGGTLQQQIYGAIRRAIVDGLLAPATRLPSSRALASDLRVSRATVVLALEQLIAEGYVATRPGSGCYVARELPDERPRARAPAPAPTGQHPPLSARGAALAEVKPRAWRIIGPPRPFRLGTPAIDQFPIALWSQLANRRWRAARATQLDYGEWPPLRQVIVDHLQVARGTRCVAEQVLVTAGSQGGLDLMARLLLNPGDAVWFEEPGYNGAQGLFRVAGARLVPVPVDDEGLDVAAGMRRAGDARLAYVTPSHQFPLGVVMSPRRRQALLAWANAAHAWVLEDDYDSEFRYGTRPIPCLHGIDGDGRVIYVGTFSKTLFPQLRLGFLVVPPDIAERLVQARRTLELQPPVLNQVVLADFIERGHYERHLRRMRSLYRERLEAFQSAAERYCGGVLRLRPVVAGLHAVGDLDGVDDTRVLEEAIARGVEVMPLSNYFTGAEARHGLVLGFATVRPEESDDGMRRLAAAIEAARAPGRRPVPAGVVRG